MSDLPKGHSWVHKGGLYFYCKNCKCRIVKEIVPEENFTIKYRVQTLIDDDRWTLSNQKVPKNCEEANMNEALE